MSALLSTITERWISVIKENDADLELVTEQDQKQWIKFKEEVSGRLKTIIKGYTGDDLSDSDTDWLRNLNNTFDRANHVDRAELLEKKKAREEALRKKIEEEERIKAEEERRQAEVSELRSSLLSKLDF